MLSTDTLQLIYLIYLKYQTLIVNQLIKRKSLINIFKVLSINALQ